MLLYKFRNNFDSVALFIPIIMITFLIISPNEFIEFLHTVLGKLLSILLIIFYSFVDIIYGVLVAVILVFLYQSQIYENMIQFDAVTKNWIRSTVKMMEHLQQPIQKWKPVILPLILWFLILKPRVFH